MTTLQIVETSLRDGNQCLWGALGHRYRQDADRRPADGARRLSRDRLHHLTHMGVAVRYKQRGPVGADPG